VPASSGNVYYKVVGCSNSELPQCDCHAVVTCEIKLFQPSSTSIWNNFISAHRKLAWNYFSGLLKLMSIYPTCSLLLK